MEQSSFRFKNPALTDMTYALNEQFNPKNAPERFPLNVSVTTRREPDQFSAIVSVKVQVAEESAEYPFHLSATMSTEFSWDESYPPRMVDSLVKFNAPALLLGYLRPYISQITCAGLGHPINIPFMDFTQNRENEKVNCDL